jgi:hypothetical protein
MTKNIASKRRDTGASTCAESEPQKWEEIWMLDKLFKCVSGTWDTGGSSYCATRTWFGSGLSEAFDRLARHERVPEADRPALIHMMRDAMPPCRNCQCVGVGRMRAAVRGESSRTR